MISFLAGFIVGCMFATGAIFLFCAFAYDPLQYPDRPALDTPKPTKRLSRIQNDNQRDGERASREGR